MVILISVYISPGVQVEVKEQGRPCRSVCLLALFVPLSFPFPVGHEVLLFMIHPVWILVTHV